MQTRIPITDDYTRPYELTWKLFNNGVLFKTFGSHVLDDNVYSSIAYIYLDFDIVYDTNYNFSISCIDDDGIECARSPERSYNLATP